MGRYLNQVSLNKTKADGEKVYPLSNDTEFDVSLFNGMKCSPVTQFTVIVESKKAAEHVVRNVQTALKDDSKSVTDLMTHGKLPVQLQGKYKGKSQPDGKFLRLSFTIPFSGKINGICKIIREKLESLGYSSTSVVKQNLLKLSFNANNYIEESKKGKNPILFSGGFVFIPPNPNKENKKLNPNQDYWLPLVMNNEEIDTIIYDELSVEDKLKMVPIYLSDYLNGSTNDHMKPITNVTGFGNRFVIGGYVIDELPVTNQEGNKTGEYGGRFEAASIRFIKNLETGDLEAVAIQSKIANNGKPLQCKSINSILDDIIAKSVHPKTLKPFTENQQFKDAMSTVFDKWISIFEFVEEEEVVQCDSE